MEKRTLWEKEKMLVIRVSYKRLAEIQEGITSALCRRFHEDNVDFSSTGRRPASLRHGPLSVVRPSVRPSVRALTFSLNIFFSETTYWILIKFHRNVPAMVLFRIS